MIDILYIIGPMSVNYDLELKCSLRTLHKYVKDYGRIFITGDCPDFINQEKVIYTPMKNLVAAPMINHWAKVQKTIDETDIGENFVLMYDDIFFTKPTSLTEYPHYQKGKLGESYDGGWEYQKTLRKTKKFLEEHNQETYDYELHIPFIYNKHNFTKLKSIFETQVKEKFPYAVRSIYGNLFEPNQPYKHDVKIRTASDTKDEKIMGQECISASDYTFPFIVSPYLEEHVQERSPWEK